MVVLGGGKFGDGALTGSMGYVFNYSVHTSAQKKARYKQVIESDGKITHGEARYWSHHGGGAPLNADLSKIDLSQISASEFASPNNPSGIGNTTSIQTLFRSNDGYVYGNIILKLHPNNVVTAPLGYDEYNFEMHYPLLDSLVRNAATLGGRIINFGEGDKFKIMLHGSGKIGP